MTTSTTTHDSEDLEALFDSILAASQKTEIKEQKIDAGTAPVDAQNNVQSPGNPPIFSGSQK